MAFLGPGGFSELGIPTVRSPGKHRWSVTWLEIKENLGRIVVLSRRLREFNLAISSMVKLEREIEESSSKSLVLTASSSAFAA